MTVLIKGDLKRRKEVISILKKLGGKNTADFFGDDAASYYYILEDGKIWKESNINAIPKPHLIFTVEEFNTKYPFNIGDKVLVYDKKEAVIEKLTIGYDGKAWYRTNIGVYLQSEINYYHKYNIGEKVYSPAGFIVTISQIKREGGSTIYTVVYDKGEKSAFVEETLSPIINKEIMKDTRVVTLTLEQAKNFYNKGGELKELALTVFTEDELKYSSLPETWVEYTKISKEACDSYLKIYKYLNNNTRAFIKLKMLRDFYRQTDDSSSNSLQTYNIINCNGNIVIYPSTIEARFLSFNNKELAEKFLKHFVSFIREAKDLI